MVSVWLWEVKRCKRLCNQSSFFCNQHLHHLAIILLLRNLHTPYAIRNL
jgi:hypothetical protein